MHIEIADTCQGHTLCHMVAPELFALQDEDGHAVSLVKDSLTDEQIELARKAAAGCPERAIVLKD